MYQAVGFPDECIIFRDNIHRFVTIWAKISGRVDYRGIMTDGYEQGCILSTLDLPLGLALLTLSLIHI